MKIIRKRLYENENLPPNIRYDETCECVQTTWDGGETWVDTPAADPRYDIAGLMPPNSTLDPKCSAAEGMRNKIALVMDAFFLADSVIAAANAIAAVILVFNPPLSLLWRIVILVAEALYAIGQVALLASFTPEAYDEIQCIFYNNIGDDGQMSQAQLEEINTQICTEMSVTVCAAMGLILNLVGFVGMSNAGALNEGEGDCSDCDDLWCYRENLTVDAWSWGATMIGDNAYAQWLLFDGFVPSTSTYIIVQSNFVGHVTNIKLFYTTERDRIRINAPGQPGDDNHSEWTTGMLNDPTYELVGGLYMYSYDLDNDVTGFQVFSDPVGGSGALARIERSGTGSNPFGSDNC